MSSSEKIQLKTPEDGEKKESPVNQETKRRPGRPKKIGDPEVQRALFKEFIDKLENITHDGEKYITKNRMLNSEANNKILQEYLPKFKENFTYSRFNVMLRLENGVLNLLKKVSKLLDIKTESFIVDNKTNMFIYF